MTDSQAFILVVDHNEAHHNSVCNSVLRAGFQAIAVSNGVDAILKANFKPAAVLVELNLPGWSGFDLCRVLKGNPETRNIPVLMYNGISQTRVAVEEAKQSGASGFLSFPIQPAQLLAVMNSHATSAEQGD